MNAEDSISDVKPDLDEPSVATYGADEFQSRLVFTGLNGISPQN